MGRASGGCGRGAAQARARRAAAVVAGRLGLAAGLCAGVAGLFACESANVRECGRGGTLHEEAGQLYCVYDPAAVAGAGPSFRCPSFAPRRLDLGPYVVCTDSAAGSAAELPPGVCAAVSPACDAPEAGPTDAGAGLDAGDAGQVAEAGSPDGGPAEAGPLDAEPTDAGGGCPPRLERPVVEIAEDLAASATWTCANRYRLTATVAVDDGFTLTIEPGTVVEAARGAHLVIADGGRIEAVGTAEQPIVFDAIDPRPGGWGGLALCGLASTGALALVGNIFGFTDTRGFYGGDDDAHDCGTLRYVRIEHAGDPASGEASNGLTLAACGSGTSIADVQVHASLDDGIELRGGNVDLRRVVVSAAGARALVWDTGWVGRVQQLVVWQSPAGAAGATRPPALDAQTVGTPRRHSDVRIFNATLVGAPAGAAGGALRVGHGGALLVRDAIVLGFAGPLLDVLDPETGALAAIEPPGTGVEQSLLPDAVFESPALLDDDVDEEALVHAPGRGNRFVDPLLPAVGAPGSGGLVPPAASPAATGAASPPDDGFFDPAATFVGAFEPGGADWTAGWTAYAEP